MSITPNLTKLDQGANYESIFDLIKKTAIKYDASFCENCGKLDYGYGLIRNKEGEVGCIHCNRITSKHSKYEILMFALDIIEGLLKYFDAYRNTYFEQKQRILQEIENFKTNQISKEKIENDSQIIIIQAFFKSLDSFLGGMKEEPLFSVKAGFINYINDKNTVKILPYLHSSKVILNCFQYIGAYETENEYVIDVKTQVTILKIIKSKDGNYWAGKYSINMLNLLSIPCPRCKLLSKFEILSSLITSSLNNTVHDYPKFISERIVDKLICPGCQNHFQLLTTFLFVNDEYTFALLYIPSKLDSEKILSNHKNSIGNMFNEYNYLRYPAVFRNWNAFKNKIHLLESITTDRNKRTGILKIRNNRKNAIDDVDEEERIMRALRNGDGDLYGF